MATEALTEIELFQRFLTERIENGGRNLSIEESIEAFRAYQRDIDRCSEAIRPAL